MIMEYCSGGDLQQVLLTEGCPGLPVQRTLKISAEARALEPCGNGRFSSIFIDFQAISRDFDGFPSISHEFMTCKGRRSPSRAGHPGPRAPALPRHRLPGPEAGERGAREGRLGQADGLRPCEAVPRRPRRHLGGLLGPLRWRLRAWKRRRRATVGRMRASRRPSVGPMAMRRPK